MEYRENSAKIWQISEKTKLPEKIKISNIYTVYELQYLVNYTVFLGFVG